MVVVVRLQGFEGEGPEPFIQQFARAATDDVSPEVKYEYTSVLAEADRFREILAVFDLQDLSPKGLNDLVKLMATFIHVKKNRDALNARNAVTNMFGLMQTLVNSSLPELFSEVIAITSALIAESPESIDRPDEKLAFIFDALPKPLIRSHESVLAPFLALIPPIASRAKELAPLSFASSSIRSGQPMRTHRITFFAPSHRFTCSTDSRNSSSASPRNTPKSAI
jgi:hypothetical protein